jgi:broad specificity phosphatase PhoE
MLPSLHLESQGAKFTRVLAGVTEANEFAEANGVPDYGSPGFKDPGLRDTQLTPRGVAQAEALNRKLQQQAERWERNMDEQIDLLVCSPLWRTLQTASIAFAGDRLRQVPRLVNPAVRERMWLSSDVGTPASDLAAAWAEEGWDFAGIPDTWWYTEDSERWRENDWRKAGEYVHCGEPAEPFAQRLEEFKEWLLARPEGRIAVVTHWGAIYGLTGKDLKNCEVLELRLSEFKDQPIQSTD